MKKSKLLLVLACGMLLAACGESQSSEESSESSSSSVRSASEGTDVIDGDVIGQNVRELTDAEKEASEPNASVVKKGALDLKVEDWYNVDGLDRAIVVRENDDGLIGFFSLIHNDFILAPQFEPAWLSWSIDQDNTGHVPGWINIKYENLYYLYDCFGNALLTASENAVTAKQFYIIGDVTYLRVSYGTKKDYFKYSEKGVATKIDALPAPEDVYEGPEAGTLYEEGITDLAEYGAEGFTMMRTNGGTYVLFKEGKYLNAVTLNTDETNIAMFGTKILAQKTYQLPDDAEDYDFLVEQDGFRDVDVKSIKYRLETHWVDLTNGARTAVDTPIVFAGQGVPYKNKEGIYAYYRARLVVIPENRIYRNDLMQVRFFDSGLVLHDRFNDLDQTGLVPLSETRFYSENLKMIFDENMEPIATLNGISNLTLNRKANVFMGRIDGKYGLIDFDGVVKAEFKYSNIYVNEALNGKVIAFDGANAAYRIDIAAGKATLVSSDAYYVRKNIFRFDTNDKVTFFSAEKEIASIDLKDVEGGINGVGTFEMPNLNPGTNEGRALAVGYFTLDENEERDQFHSFFLDYGDVVYAKPTVDPITEAVTHQTGDSLEERETIVLGENKFHMHRNGGYLYLSFQATKDGNYHFFLPSGFNLNYINYINYDEEGEASIGSSIGYNSFYAGNGDFKEDVDKYTSGYRIALYAKDEDKDVSGEYLLRLTNYYNWTDYQLNDLLVEYSPGYTADWPVEIRSDAQTATFTPSKILKARDYFYGQFVLAQGGGWFTLTSGTEGLTFVEEWDNNPYVTKNIGVTTFSTTNFVARYNEEIETDAILNITFLKEALPNNYRASPFAMDLSAEGRDWLGKYDSLSEQMYAIYKVEHTGKYSFLFNGYYSSDKETWNSYYIGTVPYEVLDEDGKTISTGSYYGSYINCYEGQSLLFKPWVYTDKDYTTKINMRVAPQAYYSLENPDTLSGGNYSISTNNSTCASYYRFSHSQTIDITGIDNPEAGKVMLYHVKLDEQGNRVIRSQSELKIGSHFIAVEEEDNYCVIGFTKRDSTSVGTWFYFSATELIGLRDISEWAGNDEAALFVRLVTSTYASGYYVPVVYNSAPKGNNVVLVGGAAGFVLPSGIGTIETFSLRRYPKGTTQSQAATAELWNKSDEKTWDDAKWFISIDLNPGA